jgi:hypothetical protein
MMEPPLMASAERVRLVNVEMHILPAGQHAYVLDHTSPDPTLPAGMWVVQKEDEVTQDLQGQLMMQLLDPRGDSPNVRPLPRHLQPTLDAELVLVPGVMHYFPGNVPWHITPNLQQSDVIYLTFQFDMEEEEDADGKSATDARCAEVDGNTCDNSPPPPLAPHLQHLQQPPYSWMSELDGVRCAFSTGHLHPRMPLVLTEERAVQASRRVVNDIPLGWPLSYQFTL